MRLATICALGLLAIALPAQAQTRSQSRGGLFGTSPHQPDVDDKTGTNPLNLQQQIDLNNTYITLDTLYLNTTTYRHAVPLFNRRVRLSGLLPIAFSNLTGSTEGGLGDVGADVEWTPWLSAHGGLVAGLRTTWNTATADGIGLGTHTFMPYAQYVLQPTARSVVAPFVGQRFGAGGDDFAPPYNDTLVGVHAAWRVTPRLWVAATPQVVVDLEHDRWYGDVGGELGYLLLHRLSTYVRPSAGFGRDGETPYSWGVTVGVRVVP